MIGPVVVRLLLVGVSLMAASAGSLQSVSAARSTSGTSVSISLNCVARTERIRITNASGAPITVESIGTLADPLPSEPFTVGAQIPAGGTRLWQSGAKATGKHVLSREEVLSNIAGDDEGVKVVTSVGTLTARCPKVAPPTGEKWIEVGLASQTLTAWQGDFRVAEKTVSTGKPGFVTPPGTFFVNLKFETEDMNTCLNDECWNIPDVPWVMYFTHDGVAFHGAYWHNNFGQPRTHGCVNLPVSAAKWLYEWAPMGTRVWIHD